MSNKNFEEPERKNFLTCKSIVSTTRRAKVGEVVGRRNKSCYSCVMTLLREGKTAKEIETFVLEFASNCKDADGNPAPLSQIAALRCLVSAKKKFYSSR